MQRGETWKDLETGHFGEFRVRAATGHFGEFKVRAARRDMERRGRTRPTLKAEDGEEKQVTPYLPLDRPPYLDPFAPLNSWWGSPVWAESNPTI